jgi:hypothetical protein
MVPVKSTLSILSPIQLTYVVWRCPKRLKSKGQECSVFLWVEGEGEKKELLAMLGLLSSPKSPVSTKRMRPDDSVTKNHPGISGE